jgi:hypothetical protein
VDEVCEYLCEIKLKMRNPDDVESDSESLLLLHQ